jgi:hypothetical protein
MSFKIDQRRTGAGKFALSSTGKFRLCTCCSLYLFKPCTYPATDYPKPHTTVDPGGGGYFTYDGNCYYHNGVAYDTLSPADTIYDYDVDPTHVTPDDLVPDAWWPSTVSVEFSGIISLYDGAVSAMNGAYVVPFSRVYNTAAETHNGAFYSLSNANYRITLCFRRFSDCSFVLFYAIAGTSLDTEQHNTDVKTKYLTNYPGPLLYGNPELYMVQVDNGESVDNYFQTSTLPDNPGIPISEKDSYGYGGYMVPTWSV